MLFMRRIRSKPDKVTISSGRSSSTGSSSADTSSSTAPTAAEGYQQGVTNQVFQDPVSFEGAGEASRSGPFSTRDPTVDKGPQQQQQYHHHQQQQQQLQHHHHHQQQQQQQQRPTGRSDKGSHQKQRGTTKMNSESSKSSTTKTSILRTKTRHMGRKIPSARIYLVLILFLVLVVIALAIALAAVVDDSNRREKDCGNFVRTTPHSKTQVHSEDVTLSNGPIRGKLSATRSNFEYISYLGIPYAQFVRHWQKAVYPHPSWTDTRNATELGPECWKHGAPPAGGHMNQTDHCLTINVYTPKVSRLGYLPVMVHFDDPGYTRPNIEDILEEADDIITVTFNYRVGIWGFLYTGKGRTANFGYWDQYNALRWVHNNIRQFGGDPDLVTAWGYGAGGTSVKHMALYRKNKGLLRRIIDINGGSGSWKGLATSCRRKRDARQKGQTVAAAVGCPIYRREEMMDCLRGIDAEKLVNQSHVDWPPVVDGNIIQNVPFVQLEKEMTWGYDIMNIVSEEDTYNCTDPSYHQDIPRKDEHDFGTMADYWHWFLSDEFADSNTVVEEIFPLYNMTVDTKICDKEAIAMRKQYGHVMAQELDAVYHARFSPMWGNYHVVHTRREGRPLWYSMGLVKNDQEEEETTDTPHEEFITKELWRYMLNFVATGDPNMGKNIQTRAPKYDVDRQESLVTNGGIDSWRVAPSPYANASMVWESAAYTKDGIDYQTRCKQPKCVLNEPVVETKSGRVRGVKQYITQVLDSQAVDDTTPGDMSLDAYLAIPYAKVTRRFDKAEYPYPAWDAVYDATDYGVICHQDNNPAPALSLPHDEDCLQLYVYTPEGAACARNKHYPVLLHIHGGYTQSGADLPGKELLEVVHDVVIVSINYRLGVFGFLTTRNNSINPSNVGYWDQHMAILWVRDNIEGFGGDPRKVTLWGYSASIQPFFQGNKGMIRRVIPTGGGAISFFGANPWCCIQEGRLKRTYEMSDTFNCKTKELAGIMDCLRDVPPNELFENTKTVVHDFLPIIDGYFLEDLPYTMFEKGYYHGVDYMGGEGEISPSRITNTTNWEALCGCTNMSDFWISRFFRHQGIPLDAMAELKAVYTKFTLDLDPASPYGNRMSMLSQLPGPHFMDVNAHQTFTRDRAYVFMIGDANHDQAIIIGNGLTLKLANSLGSTKEDQYLSAEMIKHQFNFAKTGDPNKGSATQFRFPQSTRGNVRTMMYRSPIEKSEVTPYIFEGEIEFWKKYYWKTDPVDPQSHCRGNCSTYYCCERPPLL